jgi:MFS family permease
VILAWLAAGYGYGRSGFWGALTGLVAAVLCGSGITIVLGKADTGVAAHGAKRHSQRFGGLIAAIASIVGAYYGGWHWGWVWAIAGYAIGAIGMLAALAAAAITGRLTATEGYKDIRPGSDEGQEEPEVEDRPEAVGNAYGFWTWVWGYASVMVAAFVFRFCKPKVELGGFARSLLTGTYAHIVTAEDPAGELDAKNLLSPTERETANQAFFDFKFVVVYSFLFIKLAEGALKANIADLTKYAMLALWMSFKDSGMPDETAKSEATRIGEGFLERYGDLLGQHQKAGTQTGLDFLICQRFADQTLKLDILNEGDREKHFLLSSMSKNLMKLTYAYADERFGKVNVISTP